MKHVLDFEKPILELQDKLAVDNLDWSFVIQDMTADWEIYAQDLDNANSWHRWGLTGTPTLASDTWTIPVETIGGSPQGTEPNDNARIMLGFVAPQITSYNALTDKPTLGTAADNDETDFATAAQGALADTSVQQDGSGSITTITAVTQSAHDALAPPDANTFYVITGP